MSRWSVGVTTALVVVALVLSSAATPTPGPERRAPVVRTRADRLGPTPCELTDARLPPSPDLYCMELTGVPGVEGRARLELGRPAGPFTVAVTPDGSFRYRPILTLSGVPPATELGPYQGYVAWVATPTLFPEERLGVVEEGSTVLPEIDLDKFLVLVTAEPDTAAAERSGRILFRGGSPSTRMQPADVMEFALGARAPARERPEPGGEPGEGETPQPGARPGPPPTDGWLLPPMPEGLTMLPAMMALRPEVAGFVPAREGDGSGPMPSRPHQIVRLGEGDTLRLEAGVVERMVDGHPVRMYAYNGQYPGPLIHVPRDATVTVVFTNRMDQPTTVHWHGLRLDNRFDGVPGLTQDAVRPGETFVYRVYFPDPGLYWYHPHVREDVQQDLGLYGNMVVRDPRGDYYGPAHREEVLMLDDLLVASDGSMPFGRERATHGFMGRFGNTFLVNGEAGWSMEARRGEVVRFFLTNVANTRTFNLSFRGPDAVGVASPADLKVVGSDVGNYEREERVSSVVIAPAERYIVHARFEEPGTYTLVNRVRGIDHLFGTFFPAEDTLGTVRVVDEEAPPGPTEAFDRLREHRWVSEEIEAYRGEFDRPVDRELELVLETGELPFVVERLMQFDSAYFHPVEWSGTMPTMNWASTGEEARWSLLDPATGRMNMDIRWRFEVGDVAKVRIHNRRHVLHAMQHPIHFHGQRFLVLSVNGVPNDNLVWKDTVLVPVGSTVDLLLELSNPGDWMAHCHIAEHLEAGMMMAFEVH